MADRDERGLLDEALSVERELLARMDELLAELPQQSPYRDVIERNREWLAAAIDEAEARRAGGSTIRSAHRPSPDSARRMMDKALAMQERVASRVAAAKRPAPVSGGVEDPAVR